MKILVVCQDFYPKISPRSFRATELVKKFSVLGHDVTILTKVLGEDKGIFEQQFGVRIINYPDYIFEIHDYQRLSLIKKFFLKLMAATGFSNYYFFPHFFLKKSIEKGLEGIGNYELLISIASPHSIHWGVSEYLKKNSEFSKTWIADCGDPFMGNPFVKRSKLFWKYEEDFSRHADHISVPIESAKQAYLTKFQNKIVVIPQGFNFELDKKELSPYKKNDIPTFAYAGVFYKNGRDPSEILDYLKELKLEFKFYIYTSSKKLVRSVVGVDQRFVILDYVPRKELLGTLSKMDFLLNVENFGNVQQPSKLIDYYLVNRPILSLKQANFERKSLDQFLKGDYEKRWINQYSFEKFDINNVANEFLKLAK